VCKDTQKVKNNTQINLKSWQNFVERDALTDAQKEQFSRYLVLLTQWNKKFNITTITQEHAIVQYHFQDSLRLADAIDMKAVKGVADVGSGGGFPGIPLKIMYPDMFVVLIEVNQKKVQFLRTVIEQLGLVGIEVYDLDWRTFLRKTEYPVDLFVSRASLQPEDLMRVLSPAWGYDAAQLVYFATDTWEPASEAEKQFLVREHAYQVGGKKRKLIFFGKQA
jgi:16S rRNA (guanine(527)-N(7))-methyltransferase RsmG